MRVIPMWSKRQTMCPPSSYQSANGHMVSYALCSLLDLLNTVWFIGTRMCNRTSYAQVSECMSYHGVIGGT